MSALLDLDALERLLATEGADVGEALLVAAPALLARIRADAERIAALEHQLATCLQHIAILTGKGTP